MKKLFIILFINIGLLNASSIYSPILEIETDGIVKDISLYKDELLIGTENGILQVYDYEKKTFIKTIKLENIKDFIGDIISPRVFSVDKMDNRYLLLSESGNGGYANLWIHENNITKQIISADDKKTIVKARFIDKSHILLGYLGNEASLFNIERKEELYRKRLTPSKFSDFALREDRIRAVFSCESGVITLIDVYSGTVLNILKGVNLDNVYKVDFKKNIVSGAGQDRRASLYNITMDSGDYIEGSFLIYATGLSPSSNRVAFAMDEKNDISIFNRHSKIKIATLKGQNSTLSSIIFKNENILFSSSSDTTVMMWKIK